MAVPKNQGQTQTPEDVQANAGVDGDIEAVSWEAWNWNGRRRAVGKAGGHQSLGK